MKEFANIIVVGGTIAAGKSSLVGSLPFKVVQELDPNDELQNILLEKMYEGDPIAKQVFQLDMMLTRFDKYKKAAKSGEMHVFDRMIFEDVLFAEMLLKDIPNVWNYYKSIWEDKVEELVNELGKPKLYFFLKVNWDNFVKRIFNRNRPAEMNNFEKNSEYFKKLLDRYEDHLITILNKYEIEYHVIDTNKLNRIEVIEEATAVLKERGIL